MSNILPFRQSLVGYNASAILPSERNEFLTVARQAGHLSSHFHTSLPIPISSPHATISEPLLLPNLDLLLNLLQTLLSSPPRSLSMSRRHSNEDTLLLDVNLAQSMRNSNRNKTMLFTYGACNSLQRTESQRRVRRIRKMCDCLAIERIASATYKRPTVLAYCVVSVRV